MVSYSLLRGCVICLIVLLTLLQFNLCVTIGQRIGMEVGGFFEKIGYMGELVSALRRGMY